MKYYINFTNQCQFYTFNLSTYSNTKFHWFIQRPGSVPALTEYPELLAELVIPSPAEGFSRGHSRAHARKKGERERDGYGDGEGEGERFRLPSVGGR